MLVRVCEVFGLLEGWQNIFMEMDYGPNQQQFDIDAKNIVRKLKTKNK
jgi:hypothetical protein